MIKHPEFIENRAIVGCALTQLEKNDLAEKASKADDWPKLMEYVSIVSQECRLRNDGQLILEPLWASGLVYG